MAYYSDKWTDKELEALEKQIAEVFKEAEKDLNKEVKEYFAKFKLRDKEMQALVDAGEMSKADYQQWRMTQIGRGQRFEALRDKVAERYTQANEVANAYVNDMTPSIYSLNRNYEAYTIEKAVGSCDFTLWDESTVRKLLVEQPDLMPYYPPSRALDRGIDLAYGKSQITKQVTSGIIRGLAPGKIANELMANISTMNRDSAVRAARTGITAAQNAGRMDSYIAAEKLGIQIRRKWVCTKDARTRFSHGMADGQIVEGTKTPFIVGGYKMMFPGDKSMGAPGHEIYNCRCTTRTVEKDGIEAEPRQMRVTNPKWEEAKAEETKLAAEVDKLKEREQAETDPEKRKELRRDRIDAQKELSAATKKRQGVDKDVVVNEMTYSEWAKWKKTSISNTDLYEKSLVYGDDAITVNRKYIKSQAYRLKYRGITTKAKVDDAVCKYSREILAQKSGTENEVLVLLDADNGTLIHRKNNKSKNRVDYSKSLLQAIEKAKKEGRNILAIHNHPNGLPPTADDCVSAALHGYSIGVVCGHNGAVYTYKPSDIIYTESECAKIHSAISLQLQGTPVEDIDKTWLEMLKLFNLDADVR